MTEEKVTDLEFGLRPEFALTNIGKVIPNVLHFISTITQWKNGKFCLGCFATEIAKLSLNDTNVDENWIESKKEQNFEDIGQSIELFHKIKMKSLYEMSQSSKSMQMIISLD